jgi:hypothetical protein
MSRFLIATAVLIALTVAPAFAQSIPVLRADVPFDFTVGKAVLPAGEYQVGDGLNRGTITVRSLDGRQSATVLTYGRDLKGSDAGESNLTFRRVDGKAYLVSITRRANSLDLKAPAGGEHVIVALTTAPRVR